MRGVHLKVNIMSTQAEKKAWYKSKTIWVSFFTLIYGIIAFMKPEMAVDGGTVATAAGIIFMVLRALTGVQISWSDLKE